MITVKASMVLRHLEFVRLDATRAMAILVSEDEQVESRIMDTPPELTASALNPG